MPRNPNVVDTEVVKISTTPYVVRWLDRLAKTGRYGKNPSAVAEELLRRKVSEIEDTERATGTGSKKRK